MGGKREALCGGDRRLPMVLREGNKRRLGVVGEGGPSAASCLLAESLNIAPFQRQAQMGLRCNRSAMGLQVTTLGEGVEQRPSSKQRGMLLLQDLADPWAGKGVRGSGWRRWGLLLSSLPSFRE